MNVSIQNLDTLPGADLVRKGMDDLNEGRLSEFALLVLVAKTRLAALGLVIPQPRVNFNNPVSRALYDYLTARYGDDAYGRYNSLLRRMASFAHALERERQTP